MRGGIRDLGRAVLAAALFAGGCSLSNVLPGGFSGETGGAPATVVDASAGSGGSPGTGGNLGTGGILGVDASTSVPICIGVAPASPLIANFDDGTGRTFGVYGIDPVVGGTNTQPPLLRQDFSQGNWHVYGTVPQSATSFYLYWSCPSLTTGGCTLDASRYLGIEFTISGNAGPTNTLTLKVGRSEDELAFPGGGCASCVRSDAGLVGVCQDPTTTIDLGSNQTAHRVSVSWGQLGGGLPAGGIIPHAITSIGWTFPPAVSATDAAASYDVDIRIDDIVLIPDIGP